MALNVDTTSALRKILVKSWIDLGKVRLQVAGKTVIVRGRLQRNGDQEPVDGMTIEELDRKMSSLAAVKFIRWELENFKHEKGAWKTRPTD